MTARLLLGCAPTGRTLVSPLAQRQGELLVAAEDENTVRTLREDGVTAEVVALTDSAALAALHDDPDTVIVALEDGARSLAVARAARTAFPDAFLAVFGSLGVDLPDAVDTVADEVVHPLAATTSFLLGRTGEESVHTRKLIGVLRNLDGPLAVVTHDNPDPDAIASAVTLQRIATMVGCDADVCYFGRISHQENRAFVNLLEYDLTLLEAGAELAEYEGVALVDHSRPGVNDGLPEDTPIDIVIDHHPPRMPVEARYVDLRSDVGATSTLLVDYLRLLDVTPSEAIATGLLFGIHVDTDEFTREVSPADFEAAAYVQPHADLATLERIESPSMSSETLDTIARAIANRDRHGPVLVSGVGDLSHRDALAQAADRLLNLEGVTTTFVYGVMDGTVYASARARGTDIDLGETVRDAFGQIGSAGGHADMAGAQISLGLLGAVDDAEESLSEVLSSIVSDRFLDAVDSRTHRVIRDVYPDEFHGVEDFDARALRLDAEADDEPAEDGHADDPADSAAGDETDGSDERDSDDGDDAEGSDERDSDDGDDEGDGSGGDGTDVSA
jgi:nanoRNase/pAp phosphatase (c-di-AMP/oligoRNAs hydrolase)